MGGLGTRTHRASGDKSLDIRLHGGPLEMSLSKDRVNSRMTGEAGGVIPLEDLGTYSVRDEETSRRTSTSVGLVPLSLPHQGLNFPGNRRHNTGRRKGSQEDTCPLSKGRPLKKNLSMSSQSTSSQSEECSPRVNPMFMKTHKTASSTVLNILFRFGEKHKLKFAFPDGRNDFFYPSPFLCSKVRDYRPGDCFNIVCNHMRFDHQEVAKVLPPDAAYFTILRNPVDLFESSFHYYQRDVPLTWRIDGGNKVVKFLNNPQSFYSPQAYNSFYLKNLLFFDFGFDNNLEADDPLVMMNIHSLSKQFDLVLIAEYFDESLILLKETLCWTTEDILYFKLNARKSSSVSRLTPELRAKALQWNGADWRLYQHFNATFWARVEEFGRERMKREVKELNRRNAEMKVICIEYGGAQIAPAGCFISV
ncbi:galactosylceramide sulfotransferase-like [Micropterus dolomieu]|uniref:galactosylceramide sulfotransferase-like n=1 Tax=Micropterus dolomieu TaxID=147949 RepID=UPI001E8CCA71|nr:galactosylceramide sulfotransferase-like [Micropterus dolomieu]